MDTRYPIVVISIFILLSVGLTRPGIAQIPQDHAYQVTLRNYLAGFSEDDFVLELQPLTYDDSYFTSLDDLHAAWIVLENFGRQSTIDMSGLRVAAKYFTLDEIERDGQVYMRTGRSSGFFDPVTAAWWVTWDYQGNPYYQNNTLKKRVFAATSVDLMMTDQYLDQTPAYQRSDYVGGYLTKFAYVYYVTKDILPADVQAAYETGLIKFFERIESYIPYGTGGADMEAFQLPGLWYAAESIGSIDLRNRARARARYVMESIMVANGHYHHHGTDGIDLSYEGILQYFLSWAALLFDDPVINEYVTKSAKLKAYLTLPEPTGHFFSPSNFNTGTANGSANDQWYSLQRDHAMAMLTDEAKYLVWTGRTPPPWYLEGIPTEDELRTYIPQTLNARHVDVVSDAWAWLMPSDNNPGVWRAQHWLFGLPAAGIRYPAGFYDELIAMQTADDERTQLPVTRVENYIESFGDAFVVAKFDRYSAVVHTGKTVAAWANGVPGLSGGSLSAFWTSETGSVILGRSRGTQNADADQWSGDLGWETWAVHAISGVNTSGKSFSSARNREFLVNTEIEANASARINIVGAIGAHDNGISAPEGSVAGDVTYSREFLLEEKGVTVTTTLQSDGSDRVSELWEMIPLFLSDTGQNVEDAEIQFFVDDWQSAAPGLVSGVQAIRTTRFDHSVDIVFDTPREVQLSSNMWTAVHSTSRIQNVLVNLLPETGIQSMPDSTGVSYLVRPELNYVSGDVSGDGVVSAFDAAKVLQHIIYNEPLVGDFFFAADVSGDGTITAFDASLILQYLVGLIECLPSDGVCGLN